MSRRRFGPYSVDLTNLGKTLFPDSGFNKGALLDYYLCAADALLPHLKDRPLSLERFPDGIDADGFLQQHRPDYFPDWLPACKTPRAGRDGKPINHVLCRNRAGLAYLANQATVTLHGWAARAPELDRPDRMIFDLDPPGEDFEPVREAARNVVDLMQCLGMNPYLMTTGSRGMHVVAPLRPEADFDQVRTLAQAMAARLVRAHEDTLTDAHRKAQRQGRLYLDVTRNAYGQHAVMPYSVRARPGAPVATPIRLDELNAPDLDARRWNLESVPARLKRQGDPWVNIRRHATTLRHAVDAFEEAVS